MTQRYVELGAARRDGFFNIAEAAQASGVSAKMVRHYEAIGVIPKAARTSAGYRIYRDTDVHTLRFVQRSRELGFPIKEIATLVGLWRGRRNAADVQRIASRHLATLERKLAQMQAMPRTLRHLVESCHGDKRPECPILDDLSAAPAQRAAPTARPRARVANVSR